MDKFIFKDYEEDLKGGNVKFFYVLVHNDKEITLTETLNFPPVSTSVPLPLLKTLLDSLHLALGISYWKLYCPKKIETPNILLSKEQAEFWNTIYTKGLGEFYYKNKIDFRNLVSFPFDESIRGESTSLPRTNKSLVGIGGGKDSIVTAKLLQEAGKDFAGFILNPTPLQENVAKKLGIETISMKRELDPQLFELNKQSDTYNGHVPISTIYAFISLFAAALLDYRYIIVSNEKSSNYGNVEYLGQMINHQWSKSLEFEKLFQNYVSNFVTPDITYFSSLRGMYEIKITELFTKYPEFFPIFSSCNTNFKQNRLPALSDGELVELESNGWCGECAKCAFVFALLAAYLSKETVLGIFSKNLFEDKTLVQTYEELLGIKDIKPFDCVGTPDEVKLAMNKVHQKGEYKNSVAMKMFEEEVLSSLDSNNLEQELFKTQTTNLPEEFKSVFTT